MGKARKIIFAHSDLGELQGYLDSTTTNGQRFLIVESLFSMDRDIAPLKAVRCNVQEGQGCFDHRRGPCD